MFVANLGTMFVYVMKTLGASLGGTMELRAKVAKVIEDLIVHCVTTSFVVKNAVDGVEGV